MKTLVRRTLLLAAFAAGFAHAEDERFDVKRFQVEGNTLLAPAHVEALVAPFTGHKRNYGDIQKALEALEGAYRASGYGTVQVYVPEQELTQGVVRLEVSEGVVGKIVLDGNKHFSNDNIRATLPHLKEGKAPNMRQLSEDIQLANENPAKQIEVTLGVSDEEGKVDAKVNVTDEDPQKFIVTLDNTGSGSTGNWRMGFAYQNANVGNSDQVMTLAYTDSPDKPDGVKVEVYSFAYRIPFYSIGDSLDIIYGKSSVSTPSTQATGFAINGKGDVFGLRWNHYFARRGEYTSKLIAGFDNKYISTRCPGPLGGSEDSDINPPGNQANFSAPCTPYTVRPFSLAYAGQRQSPGQILDYSLSFYQNWAIGTRYDYTTAQGISGSDRYSRLNSDGNQLSQRATPDNFNYLKLAFSYLHALADDWAVRFAFNGQYSKTPLPSSEQFGIAGSAAVRGFTERAIAMDKGYFVNLELYGPELASMVGLSGSLKAVGFYDFGRSYNYLASGNQLGVGPFAKAGIASVGGGVRYSMGKDVSVRADLARVVDAGPADIVPSAAIPTPSNTEARGDWRGHVAVQVSF